MLLICLGLCPELQGLLSAGQNWTGQPPCIALLLCGGPWHCPHCLLCWQQLLLILSGLFEACRQAQMLLRALPAPHSSQQHRQQRS